MSNAAQNASLDELAEGLANYAAGLWPLEAAAGLLTAHQSWLYRHDFLRFVTHRPDDTGRLFTDVDWEAAANAELPCSTSMGNILRIAASLAGGVPVDLRDTLTGLDRTNLRLVATAIAHANGGSDAVCDVLMPVYVASGDRSVDLDSLTEAIAAALGGSWTAVLSASTRSPRELAEAIAARLPELAHLLPGSENPS